MTECVSGDVVERCCVMRECGNCSADVIGCVVEGGSWYILTCNAYIYNIIHVAFAQ